MSGATQALEALYKAPSAEECYVAAEQLAEYVNQNGLRVLQSEGILDSLVKATKNKKSGYEREAGAIGLDAIFVKAGGKNAPSPLGAEPWLLYTLPPSLSSTQTRARSFVKPLRPLLDRSSPLSRLRLLPSS